MFAIGPNSKYTWIEYYKILILQYLWIVMKEKSAQYFWRSILLNNLFARLYERNSHAKYNFQLTTFNSIKYS